MRRTESGNPSRSSVDTLVDLRTVEPKKASSRVLACAQWARRFRLGVCSGLQVWAEGLLGGVIVALLVLGCCWRDWQHSPWFDLCNLDYHTDASCNLGIFFFWEATHDGVTHAMWLWPEMCFFLATYLIWFRCTRHPHPGEAISVCVHFSCGTGWDHSQPWDPPQTRGWTALRSTRPGGSRAYWVDTE